MHRRQGALRRDARELMKEGGPATAAEPRLGWALIAVCLGSLLTAIDGTIVTVALPTIGQDLHFPYNSLLWVVNAYLVSSGGILLLAGRLGDLCGHRRMYLVGIFVFTVASMGCGLADSPALLVLSRCMQGVAGAILASVALSLIMSLFTDAPKRARALGLCAFVSAGGGSAGALLGGLITGTLGWRWVFLINVPLGVCVFFLCLALIPRDHNRAGRTRLDVVGAVAVTSAMTLAVYAIANGREIGWASLQTGGVIACSILLLAGFVVVEARAVAPLVPLSIFKRKSVAVANIVCVLWAAATCAWFFNSTLYMQRVLGYSPMQIGLTLLPMNVLIAAFSLVLSPKLVARFGIRGPLITGMLLGAAGIALFGRVPLEASLFVDMLPGMILLGLGLGIVFNPLLLAAMADVAPGDSGLASGIISTTAMMGGALGLALVASVSAAYADEMLASGFGTLEALRGGYRAGFFLAALCAGGAALLASVLLHSKNTDGGTAGEPAKPCCVMQDV